MKNSVQRNLSYTLLDLQTIGFQTDNHLLTSTEVAYTLAVAGQLLP